MLITEFVYISRPTQNFGDKELVDLLIKARNTNQKHNVTGMLLFDGHSNFIQVLEGTRSKVTRIFSSILQDTRHENIELISERYILKRNFSEWSMGFQLTQEIQQSDITALQGYVELGESKSKTEQVKGLGPELLRHFQAEIEENYQLLELINQGSRIAR